MNNHEFHTFSDDVKIPAAKETESKTPKNDVIISLATTTAGNNIQNGDKNPSPSLQFANENPLGIKIKEITKPEEIRITDDKPKPYNPFKSTTTTTTTSTTTMPSTTTVESTSEEVTSEEVGNGISTSTIMGISTENPRETFTEDTNQSSNEHESRDYMDDGAFNGDSSTSGAPPTKSSAEGEVEPQVLLVSADSNSIGDDSGNKSVRQTTENSTSGEFDQSSENNFDAYSSTTEIGYESSTSSDILSSTSGEEVDLASTPKNLVVVRHGGKTESFHISGTDGLQRVEELDVLSSTTESSHEIGDAISRESFELSSTTNNIEGKSSEELVLDSSSTTSPEIFEETVTASLEINKKLDNSLNPNDNTTEHLTSNSIEVSTAATEGSSESSSELLSIGEQVYETVYYAPEEKSTASPSSEEPIETVYFGSTSDEFDGSSTTEGFDASSPASESTTTSASVSVTDPTSAPKSTSTEPSVESTSRFSYEEEESTPAENPEYPYIPDDLSQHNKEIVEEEDKRRLPSKVVEEKFSSTAGPCNECDVAVKSVELTTKGPPLETIKETHKMDLVESRLAPGEPHLIPEWERNMSTTTTTTSEKPLTEESTTLGPSDKATSGNEINKTSIFGENVATIVGNEAIVESRVNKSEALTNIETLPNDVDSDEKYGQKEPTTERPTTKGYANIDESTEGSASSPAIEFDSSTVAGASPKDDAESIKYDSSSADDETYKSYAVEEPSFIPNSFSNYWRYVSKMNGWPAP